MEAWLRMKLILAGMMALLCLAVPLVTGITASSCSVSDVQAAVNAATDNETVIVPAGACTWTSPMRMPADKSIIVKGSGMNTTIITATGNALFLIADAEGKSWEITGFTLVGPAGQNFPYSYVISTDSWKSHCASFRIHDNIFRDCQTFRDGGCIEFRGACYGVIDHNQFIGTGPSKVAIDINDDDDSFESSVSWSSPLDLGGPSAVYIEDNYFEIAPNARLLADGSPHNWNCIDTNNGARYVARWNVFRNCYVYGHGSCYNNGHGSVKHEVYDNWVYHEGGPDEVDIWGGIGFMSGTGIIYQNVIEGSIGDPGHGRFIGFDNDRSAPSAGCIGSWHQACDGTQSIDGNEMGGQGYPCRDQPGMGPGTFPTKVPWYIWGNFGCEGSFTTPSVDCRSSPHQCVLDALEHCRTNITSIIRGRYGSTAFETYHFIQNRDYFLTEHPTWTAYTYPHPLVGQQATVCIGPADSNPCDGCVSSTELRAYLNLWQYSGVSLTNLINAIAQWKVCG
jgi:hypothetical protein